MSLDLTIPEWLNDFTAEWVHKLGLSEWHITLCLALAPNDDPEALGSLCQYPLTNSADITLRADVEDEEYWHIVVIHELLHVTHSRIDQQIEGGLIPELPEAAQGLASRGYHQVVESYTHALACALYRLIEVGKDED